MNRICTVLAFLVCSTAAIAAEQITPRVTFHPGPVNGVAIEQDGAVLAVYGLPESRPGVEQVVLTHGRRDVVWAAEPLVSAGAKAIAPSRATYWLERPGDFWNSFTTQRFHDYAQQSTKILPAPLPVDRWVKENDVVAWRGIELRVVDTPGYTRGGCSYIGEIDGKKIAFTGDLLYGDGRLLDLYSFQDAIPAAQIRGYHGYGSRLAELVASLRKIAAEQPDVIAPARGPLIRNPQQSIASLIGRVEALYRNYLSTNALHWYFKEKRMRLCGERILGPGAEIELMPYAQHEPAPNWVFEQSTSRLLIADNGHGFLLDCGNDRVIATIKDLIAKGLVKQVDGIFVTHYHDDHTDKVQAAAEQFSCPVYATSEYADILENPSAYHLPAMTANPIKNVQVMRNRATLNWEEFALTFYFFPGQAYYHGALLAKKGSERPIFFIGDAFAPSGIDDYCVLNRNLVHPRSGYLLCFEKLRQIKEPYWLVNEHIPFVFSFSADELAYLEDRYQKRIAILRELFPWDDPNYGIDEQWAVFYPYGSQVQSGDSIQLEVRLTNHSPQTRTFTVTPRAHGALTLASQAVTLSLAPRQSAAARVEARAGARPGNYLVTADVSSEGMEFREWVEALVTVEPTGE